MEVLLLQVVEGLSAPSALATITLPGFVQRGRLPAGVRWKHVKRNLTEVAQYAQFVVLRIIEGSITIWQPQIWQLKGVTPSRLGPCRALRAFLVSSLLPYHNKPQRQFRSCQLRRGQANRPPKEGISFEGL